MRVLIADDTPASRLLVRALLTDHAEIIGEAPNGAEAIVLAEQLQPDVIVMDYMMPVMDGVEATRQIKRRWPGIEVLGYTSVPSETAITEMGDAGASKTIDKLQIDELIEAVTARIPKT